MVKIVLYYVTFTTIKKFLNISTLHLKVYLILFLLLGGHAHKTSWYLLYLTVLYFLHARSFPLPSLFFSLCQPSLCERPSFCYCSPLLHLSGSSTHTYTLITSWHFKHQDDCIKFNQHFLKSSLRIQSIYFYCTLCLNMLHLINR